LKGIFTRFLARIFFVFVVYFDYEDFYQEKNIGFLSAIGYFLSLIFLMLKNFSIPSVKIFKLNYGK